MGLTLPSSPKKGELRLGHVAVPYSKRLWATDMTTAWTRLDGWVAIVPVIHCGDRLLLDCEVTKSQDALYALSPIQGALESQFGKRSNVPDG